MFNIFKKKQVQKIEEVSVNKEENTNQEAKDDGCKCGSGCCQG